MSLDSRCRTPDTLRKYQVESNAASTYNVLLAGRGQ